MPKKLYKITINKQDRSKLETIIKSGKHSAREVLRANILLNSDCSEGHSPLSVRELATLLKVSATTIQNVRREYYGSGIEKTIKRKKRETPPVRPKADGEFEAHLVALSCSDPPEGYDRWSVRLLADKCVELGYLESVSHMTVSRVLKKTNLSLI